MDSPILISIGGRLTPYYLYCIKLWILKVLKNIKISESDKFVAIIHGEDEQIATKASEIKVETYDLCTIGISSDGSILKLRIYFEENEIIIPSYHSDILIQFIKENSGFVSYIPILTYTDKLITFKGDILPSSWTFSMLKYLDYNIPWILNEEGLLINLENTVDYIRLSSEITQDIITKLSDLYYNRYIANPPKKLIELYGLIEKGNGLYKMQNYDYRLRYVSPVDFLLSRILGIDWIEYYVGKNVFLRHIICMNLPDRDFIFIGEDIRIKATSYSDILNIFRTIDKVISATYPDAIVNVLPMSTKDLSLNKDNAVVYKTDDVDKPYYYSILTYID